MCFVLCCVISIYKHEVLNCNVSQLLLLLLSILSKDTGSTKGKPVRGAPQSMYTRCAINEARNCTIY